MRIYKPVVSTQRTHAEIMLLAVENAFQNWNIIREITLNHDITMIPETTGTTETLLSRISANIHTFKGKERGNENALRLNALGGVLLTKEGLLLRQRPLHHLSEHPETRKDRCIASPLKEVAV